MSDLTDQEIAETLATYLNDIDAKICPHCKAAIEEEKQVGRCVYALPCYHRLYQGRAKREERIHPYFREQQERGE